MFKFFINGLFFLFLFGCFEDDNRKKYAGEDLYYSFDQEKIVFVNNLNFSGYTTLYPEIESDISGDTNDFIFMHQHRNDIYYIDGFNASFKEFDIRLFIEINDVTNFSFGYTNSDLSNLNIYYYRILSDTITITNEGYLFFTNTGDLVSGRWKVEGTISNQGLNIDLNQTFTRAKYENSSIVEE